MRRALILGAAFLSTVCCAKRVSRKGSTMVEHAVIVHFDYGSTDLAPIFALEDKLEQAIGAAGVGEFDGNEIAVDGSDGFLYMYGPDADTLFETVRPALEAERFMQGARVKLRYGPPEDGVRETHITLSTQPSDGSDAAGDSEGREQ